MSCPECSQYFDDYDDHTQFHIQLEAEAKENYESAVAEKQRHLSETREKLLKEDVFCSDSE